MNQDKTDSEAKRFIKAMLGESNMEIELQEQDYDIIETQTLDVLAPYYQGVKYIYSSNTSIVDLSNFPEVVSVHNVLTSTKDSSNFLQALYLGAPGVYIWDSTTMNHYLQYVALSWLYTNFIPMRSATWKFLKPVVYLHGFESSQSVLLECYVRPTKFSDIDKDSDKYYLMKQYALALAKEIVGRTRSRFTIAGAPYQLDGDKLIAEAQQEKEAVMSRIIPPIGVY